MGGSEKIVWHPESIRKTAYKIDDTAIDYSHLRGEIRGLAGGLPRMPPAISERIRARLLQIDARLAPVQLEIHAISRDLKLRTSFLVSSESEPVRISPLGEFTLGFWDGTKAMGQGLWALGRHPIASVIAIGDVATSPSKWQAFANEVGNRKDLEEGNYARWLGTLAPNLLPFALGRAAKGSTAVAAQDELAAAAGVGTTAADAVTLAARARALAAEAAVLERAAAEASVALRAAAKELELAQKAEAAATRAAQSATTEWADDVAELKALRARDASDTAIRAQEARVAEDLARSERLLAEQAHAQAMTQRAEAAARLARAELSRQTAELLGKTEAAAQAAQAAQKAQRKTT